MTPSVADEGINRPRVPLYDNISTSMVEAIFWGVFLFVEAGRRLRLNARRAHQKCQSRLLKSSSFAGCQLRFLLYMGH